MVHDIQQATQHQPEDGLMQSEAAQSAFCPSMPAGGDCLLEEGGAPLSSAEEPDRAAADVLAALQLEALCFSKHGSFENDDPCYSPTTISTTKWGYASGSVAGGAEELSVLASVASDEALGSCVPSPQRNMRSCPFSPTIGRRGVEALASPAQHELPAFGGLLEEPTFRDLGLTSQLQAEAASPGACMLPEDLYQSQEGSVWQTPSPSTLQPPPGLTRKPRPMSAGHAASRLSSPGGATSCSPAPASRHLRALQENQQQSPSTSRAGKQQHPDKRPHSAARHSHVAELQQLLQAAEMRAEAAKAAAQHAQLQEGRLAQQLAAHQSYTNNLIGELCIVLSGIDTDGSKTKDSASSQHTDNSSKPAAAGSPAPPSVKPSPISPLLGKQAPALVHQAKTAARRCVLAEQQAALSRKIAEATEVKLAAAEKRAAQLQAALQQSKCQAAAAAVSMGQQPQLTQEPQGVMLRQLMCDLTAARADNPAVQLQLLRARVPDRLWGGQNKGKKASVVMSAAAALERHKVASAAAQREVCNSITEAAAAGEKVRQLMQTWGSGGTTPAARTILSDLQQKQSLLVVAVCELLLSDFLTVLDDSQLRHCRTPWMDFPAAHVLLQPTSGSVGQTLEEARRVSEACVAAGRSLEKLLSKCGSA